MAKLNLYQFIPRTIGIEKGNRKYRLRFTFNEIPLHNKKIQKDEIGIWYEKRTPTNGRAIYYDILPKFIKEDKELYESIGLYFAEGGLHPYRVFSFSNDELETINTFMRCFQRYFKVPPSNWTWSICFNDKLKRDENKKMIEERERASVNFWLEKTEIRPESDLRIPFRYSNKNSKGKLRTRKKWGSLTIVFGNRILKTSWLKIMDKLVQKILQERNENKAASVLRGWIAGDGYCRYEVYDKARRGLGITCTDKKKIRMLYKLFDILGIQPCREEKGLGFVKAEYLVKTYNYKLTFLHPLKHLNLLKCLSSYKRIPESIKNLDLKKIREEINTVERKLKEREELFERLKNKELPKLRKEINWQFLMNGLLLKEGGNYEKLIKEIDCPKTVLIHWVKKRVKPSRKYRMKILEKIKESEREKLIKLGEFFLKENWVSLLEGLQIFLKMSRKELAKELEAHVNTLESIINQRDRIGKDLASRILNLIEKYGKAPEEIVQVYKETENLNWANEIERILIENEWSQRDLAEKLGCSRSLVREWLSGLEPVNKYKGKLLELSKYTKAIKLDFKNVIKEASKTYTFSSLQKELNVSWRTIKNWINGSRIQLRHVKKIIKLRDEINFQPKPFLTG